MTVDPGAEVACALEALLGDYRRRGDLLVELLSYARVGFLDPANERCVLAVLPVELVDRASAALSWS